MKKINLIFFTLLFFIYTQALASDFAKEQRWADQIVDYLIDGEVEWLTVDKHKILAIYTESEVSPATGAAIIIHGSGVHPNWEEVILPLRTALPENGWSTLSIQMPVLANDANYSDYADVFHEVAPRIQAAINNLQQKNIKNIVIISHSLGSTMSAYYFASSKNTPVKLFIAIGMPGDNKDNRMNNLDSLKKIKIPMLDLYGSDDLKPVLESAKNRRQSASHNTNYSQHVIKNANHFFSGKNPELIKAVTDWLKSH